MKVEIIKQVLGKERISYKIAHVNWCCEKLKDNPLAEFQYEYDSYDGTDRIPALMLSQWDIDYDGEYTLTDFYQIKYCPFCGELVEFKTIGEENVEEVYEDLNNRCNALRSKQKRLNSLEKINNISDEISKIIKKISYYNQFTWYDKENN